MLESLANFLSGGVIDKLRKSNELQSKELESVRLKLQKCFAERDKNETDYLQLSKENETKDDQIKELEKRINEQNIAFVKVSSEVVQLKDTNALLEKHLQDLKEKLDGLNSNEEVIVNTVTEDKGEPNEPIEKSLTITELTDRLETLEKEKLITNEKLKRSEKKYSNLQNDFSVANSHIEFYKKRIEDLENELKFLKDIEDKTEDLSVSIVNVPVNESTNHITTQDAHIIPGQLTIDKVINIEDGSEIDAREFFSKSEDEIMQMRRTLQDAIILDRPKFVCKYCGQMVKISGRKTERGHASFFSHLYDSDECDLMTTTGLSQALINAQKYGKNGESVRHKKIKKIIEDALRDTNSVRKGITDVQQEKTVFGSHPLFKWRRPDIYIKYNDIEIVFELQLSTTFASVIAEREMFYKMNNIFLIWIFNFAENEEHVDLRNLMMKDIYYENHRNVFIIDSEAYEEGLKRKELVLKCDWLEADGRWHYSGNENYGCNGEFVTLSDLTYNTATYKPYFHDISAEQTSPVDITSAKIHDSKTKEIINLLDKKHQKILQRQQQEELKRRTILDALDVDAIEHEYVRLKVATVKKDNRYGLYNFEDKKEILPAVYRAIKLWNNGRFFLVEDEQIRFGLVNTKGETVVPLEYESISKPENGVAIGTYKEEGVKMNSFISLYRNDRFDINKGFLDLEEVGNSIYISTRNNNGLYLKGLVSKTGSIIAGNVYTNIFEFSNGLFVAVRDGKYGILNDKGDKVIPLMYDKISTLVNGKAEISLDENIGYLNNKGHIIYETRKPVNAALRTEKRKFLNEWRLFDKTNTDLSRHGYEEICHYQGHLVSFTSQKIISDKNISADKECGVEAELTEKTRTGFLFKFGSRVAKMNKRQLQRKPEGLTYEKGKTYTVYVSCIKEDLNLIYLSPIPCFGPTIRNNKKKFAYGNKR